MLLLLTSLGWAFWVHAFLRSQAPFRLRTAVVNLCAGFAIQILLLQNMVYLDVPVKFGVVIPAAIGVAGAYRIFRGWLKASVPDRWSTDLRWMVALLFLTCSVQMVSVAIEGSTDFYGKAKIDHANYAMTTEMLLTKPFSTPISEVGLEPWLVKAIEYKDMRIGQSVAQAYAAALVFGHSKEAFAPTSIFFVAMLALVCYSLARTLSLSPVLSFAVAFWTGIAPATTRIYLDGFMSQAAVLFVFPCLVLWSTQVWLPGRTREWRRTVLLPTVLLSYLLVCYTEYYVIGLTLVGLMTLVFTYRAGFGAILSSAQSIVFSLALVPMYLPKAIRFSAAQYQFAGGANPAVEVLAPNAGTLYGWARVLVTFPWLPPAAEHRITVLIGILLALFCAVGFLRTSLRTRAHLGPAVISAWLVLGAIASAPVFVKYPYGKIMDSFTFLWALLAMLGMAHTWLALKRSSFSVLAPAWLAVPTLFVLAGLAGAAIEHGTVLHHEASLSLLASAGAKSAFAYAENHPHKTYKVKDPDGLFTIWASYHGRNSQVFIDSSMISDRPLPRNSFSFNKLSKLPTGVTILTRSGYVDESSSNGLPNVIVNNPQDEDRQGDAFWYWLGDSLDFEIYRWGNDNQITETELAFQAEPGPANPSPIRRMVMTSMQDGTQTPILISGTQKVIIPVRLKSGNNIFHLETGPPNEHVTKLAGDSRKHLVRIYNIAIQRGRMVQGDAPLLSSAAPESPLSTPVLVVNNPQGEDRSGQDRWYWVGKSMDFEVLRSDNAKAAFIYQLSVQAQAGPANPDPKRRIAIRNLQDNTTRSFDFQGTTVISTLLTATAGSSRFRVEVLAPTVQTVTIPNDPRNHMVRMEKFDLKLIKGAQQAPQQKTTAASR